jgi:clan AA aspartic protease
MMNVEHRSRFTRTPDDCMGEIRSTLQLENADDRAVFERGHLDEDAIRSVEIEGVVDTGARTLALPQEVVERLGVRTLREVNVGYADDRRETRPMVGPINVTIAGRTTVAEAVVLPSGSEALVGQTVLESLDLVADCANERLAPSPESPDLPFLPLR